MHIAVKTEMNANIIIPYTNRTSHEKQQAFDRKYIDMLQAHTFQKRHENVKKARWYQRRKKGR